MFSIYFDKYFQSPKIYICIPQRVTIENQRFLHQIPFLTQPILSRLKTSTGGSRHGPSCWTSYEDYLKEKHITEQLHRENSQTEMSTCCYDRGRCHLWGGHVEEVNQLLLHRGQGYVNAVQI